MAKNVVGNNARKLEDIKQLNKRNVNHSKSELKVVKDKRTNVAFLKFCNVLLVILISCCAVSLLIGYTNLTVTTKNISTLNTKLTKLESQQVLLNAQIDNLFNLQFVEQYALSKLNMIKLDNSQIEQVNIKNDDKILTRGQERTSKSLSNTFKDIYFNLLEYIK